jgi:hypothetical protein
METENPPSEESTLAKTVAMLRRAMGLLKETPRSNGPR